MKPITLDLQIIGWSFNISYSQSFIITTMDFNKSSEQKLQSHCLKIKYESKIMISHR